MELASCHTVLVLLGALVARSVVCATLTPSDDTDVRTTLIKRMDHIQGQLTDASNSMKALDSEIEQALYNCLGIHSELCEALELEAELNSRGKLSSFFSPGKRSSDPDLNKVRVLFGEFRRKRKMLNRLMGVVRGADNVLRTERKRSCSLNLGFHCQTEEISNFADMYDFLSSARSPGKKRDVSVPA